MGNCLKDGSKEGGHDTDLGLKGVLLERQHQLLEHQALERMHRHARLAACRMFENGAALLTDGILLPYCTATGDADVMDMLRRQVDTVRMIYGIGSIDLVIGDSIDDALADYEEMADSLVLALCGVGMIGAQPDPDGETGWSWLETGMDAATIERYPSCEDCMAGIERRIDECMMQLVPCEIGYDAGTAGYAEIDGRRVELPDDVTKAARALCMVQSARQDVIVMGRDDICELLGDIVGLLV